MPTATKLATKTFTDQKFWTLYYHFGNTIPQTLNFPFEGSMAEAANRAREHCTVMGYRFIKIRPFIVDLQDREERKLSGKHVEDSAVLR